MSEYIANLNSVPTAQDIQAADAEFNLEDDLAMFTNANFFDFDMGQDTDLSVNNFGVEGTSAPSVAPEDINLKSFDLANGKLFCCLSFAYLLSFFICAERPLGA